MDFRHLQTFAAVVEHRSFSRAAEELFISQPTISQHIRQLEAELKTRLIIRTTKSIEITPKGQEVYEYAVSILSLKDRMCEDCSIENRRSIHIGASTIPAGYILPDILPLYQQQHPDVRLRITQGDSRTVTEKLLERTIDLGVVGIDPENEHITAIPFAEDPLVIITPANDHFRNLKNKKTAPLPELLNEPFIFREEGSGSRVAAELALEALGVSVHSLKSIAFIRDIESIRNLVAAGLGVSIISQRTCTSHHGSPGFLVFPLPSPKSTRKLYVIFRKEYRLNSITRDFIRLLQSGYRS